MMKTVLKDASIDSWIDQGWAQGWAQGVAEGWARGWAQGLAQGQAKMLLKLMEMRFNVPDDIRKRVERCSDREQIMAWFERVPTAASLDEIFA